MKPALPRAEQTGMQHRQARLRRLAPAPPVLPVQSAANWRMPSGLGLAEYALRGGFVAPSLMKRGPLGPGERA